MSKVGKDGKTCHCGPVFAFPTAIGVLFAFDPAQSLHHGFLTFFVAAVVGEPLQAVFFGASFPHGGGNTCETNTIFFCAAPAVSKVITITKISRRIGRVHIRYRNGGEGGCIGGDHFGH